MIICDFDLVNSDICWGFSLYIWWSWGKGLNKLLAGVRAKLTRQTFCRAELFTNPTQQVHCAGSAALSTERLCTASPQYTPLHHVSLSSSFSYIYLIRHPFNIRLFFSISLSQLSFSYQLPIQRSNPHFRNFSRSSSPLRSEPYNLRLTDWCFLVIFCCVDHSFVVVESFGLSWAVTPSFMICWWYELSLQLYINFVFGWWSTMSCHSSFMDL